MGSKFFLVAKLGVKLFNSSVQNNNKNTRTMPVNIVLGSLILTLNYDLPKECYLNYFIPIKKANSKEARLFLVFFSISSFANA